MASLREAGSMGISMTAAVAPAGKRILVVEDESMIRVLLEGMLEELGYTMAAEAGEMRQGVGLGRRVARGGGAGPPPPLRPPPPRRRPARRADHPGGRHSGQARPAVRLC